MQFSVSLLEITDAQIPLPRGREVPTRDAQIRKFKGSNVPRVGTRGMAVGDNLRLISVFRFTENPTHLATAYYC